MKNQTFVVFRV